MSADSTVAYLAGTLVGTRDQRWAEMKVACLDDLSADAKDKQSAAMMALKKDAMLAGD